MRQLKMELEEVKQQLMRQEALAAEARATASMAQQELHYWRQRVTELEPGAPNFTCFTSTSTKLHYWRQRVTELEPGESRVYLLSWYKKYKCTDT